VGAHPRLQRPEPDADFNATLKKLTFGEPTRHNIMAQAISEEGPDQELMLANALELAFDRAFVTLWDRGALSNLIVLGEIPAKAQKDMQRITVRVEAAAPKPVVQTPPPPAPPADPVAQCVGDFHELGMQAFKKKYMDDTRMRVHFELATDRGLL